jgi:ribosomal protein S18
MLLAQQFHDIAPPVDYSLIPRWLLLLGLAAAAALTIGLITWLVRARRRRSERVISPRERALVRLREAQTEIDYLSPYEFSIRVSDVLRQYVTEEYRLPLTRQTSVEFLTAASLLSRFSEEDKALLSDFLNRCDLIKFARYDATRADSQQLLEEATRFVQGGALEALA